MPFDLIIAHLALPVGGLVLGGGMAFGLFQTPTPRMRTHRSLLSHSERAGR